MLRARPRQPWRTGTSWWSGPDRPGPAPRSPPCRADPGLRVLLLDRADFPRDKCCGDGIAPHVLDVLDERRAPDDVAEGWAPLRRLQLSRGDDRGRGRDGPRRRVIPREVFDARLVERAVRPVRCCAGTGSAALEQTADGVVVDGLIRAAVAGRCRRRPLPGPRRAADRGDPVVGRWPSAATPPRRRPAAAVQVIRYGERRQPSYAWAFDRGDGLSNVGYGELLGAAAGAPVAGAAARPARTAAARHRRRRHAAGGATTCRCRAGAGTSRTGRCCWPATRPDWSTR